MDVRQCPICHREHRPGLTRRGDVTARADFCFGCHRNIGEERPSHQGFSRTGCDAVGCHHYHDNTALYEDFLKQHLNEPETNPQAALPTGPFQVEHARHDRPISTSREIQDAPDALRLAGPKLDEWLKSSHARAGLTCSGCHLASQGWKKIWLAQPNETGCRDCHAEQIAGFERGRHGMRLGRSLPLMSPKFAKLPMRSEAVGEKLGCAACHAAHSFDVRKAAVDSCLKCHADEHSLAYRGSPHAELWRAELSGNVPAGRGISCASCHLPRQSHNVAGVQAISVEHNQNANLRPTEKMAKEVCVQCHSLKFAMESIADSTLVANNFRGRPARALPAFDMVARRLSPTNATNHKPN